MANKMRSGRSKMLIALIVLLSISFFVLIHKSEKNTKSDLIKWVRSTIQAGLTPTDCEAIGLRRPSWDRRKAMIAALPTFAKIYAERPHKRNLGGMRFSHSFALWYTLRHISPKPKFVIESGADKGQSTWVILQALPDASVITITPYLPQTNFKEVKYFSNQNFADFGTINWTKQGIDIGRTALLFDDHQSHYRRILQEARKFGFKHFIVDDNCAFQTCDALSLKWMCVTSRKDEWTGHISDNFGKTTIPQSWDEHMEQAKELNAIKAYYEFPPIFLNIPIGGAVPLVDDKGTLERLVGPIANNSFEFDAYSFFGYAQF